MLAMLCSYVSYDMFHMFHAIIDDKVLYGFIYENWLKQIKFCSDISCSVNCALQCGIYGWKYF
jgi:hypothetical protein